MVTLTKNFGSVVYAATISFSAKFAYDTFGGLQCKAPGAEDHVPLVTLISRGFLGLMVLAYVVDDWFGSRECLSKASAREDLSRRLRPRFLADVAIALLCYPMLMMAIRGFVFVLPLTALHLLLGAGWLYLSKREWSRPAELSLADVWPEARTELGQRITFHCIMVFSTMALFLSVSYVPGSSLWKREFYDGGWLAGVFYFGLLVIYRVVMPWAYGKGKGE